MNTSNSPPRRKIFGRLSIVVGNTVQIAGLAAACVALALTRSTNSKPAAILAMVAAWVLLYFFCHGIAHWAVGRLLGIRFAFYTVGGTENPEGYPAGLRSLFEHLPFFGVQTEKASMQKTSPMAGCPTSRGFRDVGCLHSRRRVGSLPQSDLCLP